LKSPLTVEELGQISLEKWDKHGSQREKLFYVTPVNKIRSPDDADNDNLRILWQVDHGFLLAAV
jgi:hypothetical protein